MGSKITCCCSADNITPMSKIESTGLNISRLTRTVRNDKAHVTGKIHEMYDFEKGAKGVLASSSAGTVFKARHKKSSTYNAIRQLDKKLFKGHSWHDGIDSLLHLDHPHICRIYEVFEDSQNVYLVMELCLGGDLTSYGKSKAAKNTNEATVSLLIRQMVSALGHFHSGGRGQENSDQHVHGDICLENWLFAKPVINIQSFLDLNLKMVGFGLAQKYAGALETKKKKSDALNSRSAKRKPTTLVKDVRGASCQAPEQVDGGSKTITPKTDVWALGVIAYFLLSGQAPFKFGTSSPVGGKIGQAQFEFEPESLWSQVTQDAKDFIQACLSKDPQDRPTSLELQSFEWMAQAKRVFDEELDKKDAETQKVIVQLNSERRAANGNESARKNSARKKTRRATISINDAPLPSADDLVQSLKRIGQMSFFEKAVINAAAHRLQGNSIQNLQRQFQQMDANGDGVLSAEEIYNGVKSTGIEVEELMELLADADMDGSGTIEYTEFIAAAYNFQRNLQDHVIWSVFRTFDHDNSGSVSREEMARVLRSGTITDNDLEEDVAELKHMEAFDDALDQLDKDGDGTIDFTEFKKLLKFQR